MKSQFLSNFATEQLLSDSVFLYHAVRVLYVDRVTAAASGCDRHARRGLRTAALRLSWALSPGLANRFQESLAKNTGMSRITSNNDTTYINI